MRQSSAAAADNKSTNGTDSVKAVRLSEKGSKQDPGVYDEAIGLCIMSGYTRHENKDT